MRIDEAIIKKLNEDPAQRKSFTFDVIQRRGVWKVSVWFNQRNLGELTPHVIGEPEVKSLTDYLKGVVSKYGGVMAKEGRFTRAGGPRGLYGFDFKGDPDSVVLFISALEADDWTASYIGSGDFREVISRAGKEGQAADLLSSLTRKVRKLIGSGRTESGRGTVTMYFSRGEEAWRKAKANLDRAFGSGEEQSEMFPWYPGEPHGVMQQLYAYDSGLSDQIEGVKSHQIMLKGFSEGANNYVEFPYMGFPEVEASTDVEQS